ncbi:hypothetical protein GCM10009755_21940 [Brevibacterium samyangense]|uniref:Uncharacterized protein n=1 Tax=Brevibacterium samyangense TaxID=366888 RepID=A0ABN2TIR8_9MICO
MRADAVGWPERNAVHRDMATSFGGNGAERRCGIGGEEPPVQGRRCGIDPGSLAGGWNGKAAHRWTRGERGSGVAGGVCAVRALRLVGSRTRGPPGASAHGRANLEWTA